MVNRKNAIIAIELLVLVVVIAAVVNMVVVVSTAAENASAKNIALPNTLATISQEISDLTEDGLIHPCQQAALDNFNMYKEGANIMETYGVQSDEHRKYAEDFENREQANKDLLEVNNCESTQSEWVTPEFQKEIKVLYDEGF